MSLFVLSLLSQMSDNLKRRALVCHSNRGGHFEQHSRYDIFIASLGKDDSGQQLTVTFFKVKFAAERAELRERGAALDTEIGRRERDISALEATLRVVHAAHAHFLHRITPLTDDTPEIEELNNLMKQYYKIRDELKVVLASTVALERSVSESSALLTMLGDKCKKLSNRYAEGEGELQAARERIARQEGRLQNAQDIVKHNTKRAKKLIEGLDEWRIFQMALWARDYSEAASAALQALSETCASATPMFSRYTALLSSTDIQKHLSRSQRRLQLFIQRLIEDSAAYRQEAAYEPEPILSSSHESSGSGISEASGFEKRLSAFRKTLAEKVHEQALIDDIPVQARRSTVSLRVVSLGLEDSASAAVPSRGAPSKSLR